MGRLYEANLQIDKEGDLISPYGYNHRRCRNCMYGEVRKGGISNVCYCALKNKFVSINSLKCCFKPKSV